MHSECSPSLVQALEQMYEGIKDEVEAHQKALQVASAHALWSILSNLICASKKTSNP